jgi:type IV secretion system protein VirB9
MSHRVLGAWVLGVCGLTSALRGLAEVTPPRGVIDPRVRVSAYNGEEVYKLRGFIGYQIDLEFEKGETFTGLGAGDLEGLAFVGQDNHLFLKPKAAKVATNLTILTNRRHYQIDYAASAQKPADDQSVIYSLRFTYELSAAEAAAGAEAKRVDSQLETASDRRTRNVDYWYCGHPALRPIAAADDGVHTRLTFSAHSDLPAVFVRNDDGSESLLNFSMEGGDVIVHRVAKRFILRRGRLTGCVVNQGFSGGGLRLETGTIAPDVERRVQGAAP